MEKGLPLQKELINKNTWDVLIILDACRYDVFKEVYQNFFQGNLLKVKTNSSCTDEWCINTFSKYYDDIIYISGNPYINSIKNVTKFDAKSHFYKIYDAWKYGWNKKLGTIHPGVINQTFLYTQKKYYNKRCILHYLQPHSPYLGFNDSTGYPQPNIDTGKIITGLYGINDNLNLQRNFYKYFWKVFKSFNVGNIYVHKIMKFIGFSPLDPMDFIYSKYGISTLREAYKCNLEIVLNIISRIMDKINGRIVISADHGELLGENNMIGHPGGFYHPVLQEVPWLEIK